MENSEARKKEKSDVNIGQLIAAILLITGILLIVGIIVWFFWANTHWAIGVLVLGIALVTLGFMLGDITK